jgi:hypothetical protein
VLQLKEAIHRTLGLPAARQRLLLKGAVLKGQSVPRQQHALTPNIDAAPLSETGLTSGATVHVVEQNPAFTPASALLSPTAASEAPPSYHVRDSHFFLSIDWTRSTQARPFVC